MGKPATRITDLTNHGGEIISGENSVLIGGEPASRVTDKHACKIPAHAINLIVPLCAWNVIVGGKPQSRIDDQCVCKAKLVTGQWDVLVGTDNSVKLSRGPSRIPKFDLGKNRTEAKSTPAPPRNSYSAVDVKGFKPVESG